MFWFLFCCLVCGLFLFFFFSSRRRHTRCGRDWSSDVCSSDLDSAWLAAPLEVNEHGVVVRVSYGAARLLFEADAGLPTEARLAGQVGQVTLLKVGHHGTRSATSDAWLDELRPEEAVISVGARNNYGH